MAQKGRKDSSMVFEVYEQMLHVALYVVRLDSHCTTTHDLASRSESRDMKQQVLISDSKMSKIRVARIRSAM